jgi:hypothetical protein
MATVLRASTVENALGIQPDLVQGNWSTIPDMIAQAKYAGVDTLRIAAPTTNNPYGQFDRLAEAGFKLEFVADTAQTPQVNADAIAAFVKLHPGSVAFVEGPNEPNNFTVTYHGQSGIPAAISWQADFYAAMNANPVTAAIPVAGMSSWPAVAAASDLNNMHIYPSAGGQPAAALAEGLGVQNSVDPGKGFVVTEEGWYTAPGVTDPNPFVNGVDEPTQAKLMLNAYMDGMSQGASAVTLYSLRDWIYTDTGGHFGIFHADGTPKAAATALHNVDAILIDAAPDAATFATQALDYSVQGAAGVKSLVMEKANGDYVLALWSEPDVWNETVGNAINPATSTYTVHLGKATDTAVYDPMVGSAAIKTAAGVQDLQVSISDHPVFVTLHAAAALPPPVVIPDPPAPPAAPTPTPQPPATPAPAPGQLHLSEDAWQGDAKYIVTLDGQQLGAEQTAHAAHGAGSDVLNVQLDAGPHTVGIIFTNDAWGGTSGTDRNLYVDAVSYDGQDMGQSASLLSYSEYSHDFGSGTTPAPTPTPPVTAPPVVLPPVVISPPPAAGGTVSLGSGSHVTEFHLSEDAYQGDAQYIVILDGKQLGGTQTAHTLHGAGTDVLAVHLDGGPHTVGVIFTNDAWGGSPDTDRNLYVDAVSYDGQDMAHTAFLNSFWAQDSHLFGG